MKATPASFPPFIPKAIIDPRPFGKSFFANSWSGWSGTFGWDTQATLSWLDKYLTISSAFEQCFFILTDNVSIPCNTFQAFWGLKQGPKSLIPSALAFIVKAVGPNSSANESPWYPS